jgi:N-acetyl-anhydromuramyl-L-alanine amidase AmpD
MKRAFPARFSIIFSSLCLGSVLPGWSATAAGPATAPGGAAQGDEIVVCGRRVHTGTRVVLWSDPGGHDAYHGAVGFGRRRTNLPLSPEEARRVRDNDWDLPLLQKVVDQFVIHYDARGTSKRCFQVLQKRGLSVQFMLDLDGTVYQTLDLKERAWHATIANDRSVGIEIANMGAYAAGQPNPFGEWYTAEPSGKVSVMIPAGEEEGKALGPGWVARPARNGLIFGEVQGQSLLQYDFTPEQYAALIKLTAALCEIFPKIWRDYPRDASGRLIPAKLPDPTYQSYQGVLGHYHVQTNKTDPGPAFQWDKVINGARALMREPAAPRP